MMPTNDKGKRKKLYSPLEANEIGKLQPQSIQMEEGVLGAVLLERDSFFLVSTFLKDEHFYKEQNGLIYKAIMSLAKASAPIDLLTVSQELKRTKELELVGGSFYISSLTNNIASSANIEYHARIVVQQFMKREMIRFGVELIQKSYEDSTDCFELIDWAGTSVSSMLNGIESKTARKVGEIKDKVIQENLDALKSGVQKGIPISIDKMQSHTNGWRPGNLIILAARPAMGKTAVALDYGIYPAMEHKIPTAIFSMEMTAEELTGRLMSKYSYVSSQKINNQTTNENELSAVMKDSVVLDGVPFYIDDTPALSLTRLRSKAFRLVREQGVKLIIIDYLQLMEGVDGSHETREQVVSGISRGLKKLARELEIPIIALAQLSRQVENRPGTSKRPQLSDLRDSGAIEQDADMVIFIHRPEYYDISEYPWGNQNLPTKGLMIWIIAKYRHGGIADVLTKWKETTTSIGNWGENELDKYMAQTEMNLDAPNKNFSEPTPTTESNKDDLPF